MTSHWRYVGQTVSFVAGMILCVSALPARSATPCRMWNHLAVASATRFQGVSDVTRGGITCQRVMLGQELSYYAYSCSILYKNHDAAVQRFKLLNTRFNQCFPRMTITTRVSRVAGRRAFTHEDTSYFSNGSYMSFDLDDSPDQNGNFAVGFTAFNS